MCVRNDGATREPIVEEREQLMGYDAGATAAEYVSVAERHRAVGNAWNITAATALWSVFKCLSEIPQELPAVNMAFAQRVKKSRDLIAWATAPGKPLPFDAVE